MLAEYGVDNGKLLTQCLKPRKRRKPTEQNVGDDPRRPYVDFQAVTATQKNSWPILTVTETSTTDRPREAPRKVKAVQKVNIHT